MDLFHCILQNNIQLAMCSLNNMGSEFTRIYGGEL